MKNKDKSIKKDNPLISDVSDCQKLSKNHQNDDSSNFDTKSLVLGDPITLDQIQRKVSYLIMDEYNRIICIDKKHFLSSTRQAFVGSEKKYSKDIMPLLFNDNPLKKSAKIYGRKDKDLFNLFSDYTSKSWSYVYFAPPNYTSSDYLITFKAVPVSSSSQEAKYKLVWDNNGTEMYLCCNGKNDSWSWLYVSSTESSIFTFFNYTIRGVHLVNILMSIWPKINFPPIISDDKKYLTMTEDILKRIYNDSGLKYYIWTEDVFDCDDFSHIYKGQACKDAYAQSEDYGYAIGIILGKKGKEIHATNVFVDRYLHVKIYEPQAGKIIDAKDWEYTALFVSI
ncbi:MAG: lectin MOA-related protein [Enterobacteriaceae bacterium]|jgi:hypothetical protein|nr:lectin MOA-related protein [Enterobacteriaceae bacterium]